MFIVYIPVQSFHVSPLQHSYLVTLQCAHISKSTKLHIFFLFLCSVFWQTCFYKCKATSTFFLLRWFQIPLLALAVHTHLVLHLSCPFEVQCSPLQNLNRYLKGPSVCWRAGSAASCFLEGSWDMLLRKLGTCSWTAASSKTSPSMLDCCRTLMWG